MKQLLLLVKRDVKKTLSLRTWLIWGAMAAFCIFFFYTSSGRRDLMEQGKVQFMSLMIAQMMFGTWAVLSVFFDIVSGDRQHNVLDCILCSGVAKGRVILSKILAMMLVSMVLVVIYLLPVTVVIVVQSGNTGFFSLFTQYFFALWAFIMVFAAIGLTISVLARSSKAALILSLAAGLLLMPRFFMILVEAASSLLGWGEAVQGMVNMLSPGILLDALSDFSNGARFVQAVVYLAVSILGFGIAAAAVFCRQDELNYGE